MNILQAEHIAILRVLCDCHVNFILLPGMCPHRPERADAKAD
jgi:hypothetical protein